MKQFVESEKTREKRKTKEELEYSNSLSAYILIYSQWLLFISFTQILEKNIFIETCAFTLIINSYTYKIINRVTSLCFSEKLKQKCGSAR